MAPKREAATTDPPRRRPAAKGRANHAGPVLVGMVVGGRGLGRELGFPTANLALRPDVGLPQLGIYAGAVERAGDDVEGSLPAAISIGVRPTFEDRGDVIVEVHLIGWAGDLYGRELKVTLLSRLREELAFDTVDQLVEQIERDVQAASEVYRGFALSTRRRGDRRAT